MPGATKLNLLLFAMAAFCPPSRAVKPEMDRSYQLAPIPVINGLQGVQYVPMTAIYPGVPTVLLPKQIGMDVMALHSTQSSSVTLPPQELQQKYHERPMAVYSTGEEFRSVQDQVLQPVRNGFHLRKNKIPVYAVKRPSFYNFGRKKIAVQSPYQNQKVSSVSIEPSIDLTDQLQQLQGSFPSTTPLPPSTYGPAKVLDHQHNMHVTTYIRPKGHHPHPHYHPKDYRVYSHMHKGHVHNHFIPPGYSMHKSQYHSSVKPIYTLLKPTASAFSSNYHEAKPFQEPTYGYNLYQRPETFSTNHIRFPESELQKSLLNAYKTHQEEILSSTRFTQPLKPHSDITQAFVKEPGTINNYDASIPVKIPSKKPNKFEVKEILRNADVHFIDGTLTEPVDYPQGQYVQYSPYHEYDPTKNPYQNVIPKETAFATLNHGLSNHIDYYDQRDSPSNQQTLREEIASSESVKVPVAVIKGTHVKTPVKPQRSEESKTEKKPFAPSSTSSDWIPMSGKAISPGGFSSSSEGNDKYFADLLSTRTKTTEPTRIITSNRNIGDIISGKIPGEFSPFKQSSSRTSDVGSDIITGKIPFGEDPSEMDRRKGSVIDENPSSSDTSNLVVSSMIKFS